MDDQAEQIQAAFETLLAKRGINLHSITLKPEGDALVFTCHANSRYAYTLNHRLAPLTTELRAEGMELEIHRKLTGNEAFQRYGNQPQPLLFRAIIPNQPASVAALQSIANAPSTHAADIATSTVQHNAVAAR